MSTAEPIRVFLVDDQELVRAGFRMVLDAQPDMTVVGEADDGAAALQQLASTAADVVLMDVRMPRMDGVEATRRLGDNTAVGSPQVVVLTTFDLDEYAWAALKAGAAGFLLKDSGPTDLLTAIRNVHSGDAVVAPSTTRRLLDRFAAHLPDDRPQPPDVRLEPLTNRERDVLTAVGRGLSNTEIAEEFVVSEATVKTHITRILSKLCLRDRVHMVICAYQTGLVAPS